AGLGLSCAITELLVHDRRGIIRLLPTLPEKWAAGSIYGICARGGFEVSLAWDEGKLKSAEIASKLGGLCRVMIFNADCVIKVLSDGEEIPAEENNGVVSFETEIGKKYELLPVSKI
ncbi:MAG: glycoside hydrolase family 95-like protein, partial [Eubacteriales bacterium]